MKKILCLTLFCFSWLVNPLRAEDAPTAVDVSSAAPPVQRVEASSVPLSVGITGETISAPAPHPMTERSGPGVFVTLTRTALTNDRLPTTADVVRPAAFVKTNAQNAGEVVARQLSVATLPIGRTGTLQTARIRGAASNQSLILIDGRPAAGFALGAADLSEIPTEQIDHIEIVRGGASALYGPNAMGGVINVITKRAAYTGLPISHVGYEGGSYGRQKYSLDFGSRLGPVDFFFFGKQQWESGFRDNSDARLYNLGGNVGVSMGKAGKVQLDIASYHNNTGNPGLRCDPTDPFCLASPAALLQPNRFNDKDEKIASSPTARQVTDTNYLRASYLAALPADMFFTLRLYGQQRHTDYDDSQDPNIFLINSSDRYDQSKGGEAQLNLPLGLLIGGSFMHDRENFNNRITPGDSFTKWVENWGLFAQEAFEYGPFSLIPGVRFDQNSQFGNTTNPRVQTVVEATDWLRFSAAAARSFRAPTIDDVTPLPSFLYLGNPELRPETAWTYDAGFELHESSNSLKITYYRANVRDAIQTFVQQDPANPFSPYVAVNLGRARRQGYEVQVRQEINAYLSHELNYTYLENRAILPTSSDYVSLAFSPRHSANYGLTLHPVARVKVDSTLRYLDSRYSGNNQSGTKMGSQLTWDLRFAYMWRQLELYVGSNNVANKRYVEQPGFPLPGRTYFGGLQLRLWG